MNFFKFEKMGFFKSKRKKQAEPPSSAETPKETADSAPPIEDNSDSSTRDSNHAEQQGETPPAKIAIAATFTAEPTLATLDFWIGELCLRVENEFAPYNQVFQELHDPNSLLASNRDGMNFILFRFEDWLREHRDSKKNGESHPGPDKHIKAHLEANLSLLKTGLKSFNARVSIPTVFMICPNSPAFDNHPNWKIYLGQMRQELTDAIDELGSIECLNVSDWHTTYRVGDYYDGLRDEVGHIPFTKDYFAVLGTLIVRRYYGFTSKPYKVLVLDCDNTLWGGVCGEVSPQELNLGGAFAALQEFVISCKDRGFILCLCSKNVEEDVFKVFDTRQDMILKRSHLVDSRINWRTKSENLKSLASALNLGLDSFIFIDDNPVECAEVRAGCPEVFTIQWPANERDARNLLSHLWVFDRFSVTDEDLKRTEMYQANLERNKHQESSADFTAFLESLQLKVDMEPVNQETLPRVSQLTNRTNQFNLTTIRRSPEDIRKLVEAKTHLCMTTTVSDRFGSYGLVGVMIMEIAEDTLILDSFMLSCRVLGRGVEYRMLAEVGVQAVSLGLKNSKIVYLKTKKNAPARLFLEKVSADFPRKDTHEGFELTPESADLAALRFVAQNKEEPAHNPTTPKKESASADIGDRRILEGFLIRAAMTLVSARELASALENKSLNVASKSSSELNVSKPRLESVTARVQEVFAKALSLDRDNLDPSANMETYVDDSFKNVDITVGLDQAFGNIPATILFEHRTLGSIASWLVERDSPENGPTEVANWPQSKEKHVGPGDIAIIGMSARFPMAENIDIFWENLLNGTCAISEVPPSRWNVNHFFDADMTRSDKSYSKWGGFLEQVDRFDTLFFRISAKEAELMDPQQRMFLEVVWGLLENAGYTRATMPRKTGVFVGVIASDYSTLTSEASLYGASAYRASDYYQIPNRVSYFYDFQGPSLAVDTACSGSGTAIHLACESLRKGESKATVVGGVNLFLHPSRFVQYAQLHFLSEDDRIRPFGAEATGTLFGEGIAAILLKPLDQALAEHDHIYGVIKASAVNSGGRTNGFTVPNPQAQAELVSEALRAASIDAGTISYVEAHGTGTPLGDPIEVRGLTMAFQDNMERADNQFCALGSVKSNLGHLESAAAMSGIIKILLQMKHATLVPSLGAAQLNPKIKFEETPFYVQREAAEWKRPLNKNNQTLPFRAGISSFGAGGSNSHVILEEFVHEPQQVSQHEPHLVVLSAPDDEKLMARATQLADFLDEHVNLAQAAFTLQVGREAMSHRLAIICSSIGELRKTLAEFNSGNKDLENLYLGRVKNTAAADLLNKGGENDQVDRLIQMHNLHKLAGLWLSGVEINWTGLYKNGSVLKMALPTYPFNGDRFWIPRDGLFQGHPQKSPGMFPGLHPLLDTNESTLDEQRFKKTFTGSEFVLSHHVLSDQKILPAVAYLEIARTAGEKAYSKSRLSQLKNIVWAQKFEQDGSARDLHISLNPKGSDVAFEISTQDEASHRQVHAQGLLTYEIQTGAAQNPTMDIKDVQSRCTATLSHEEVYTLYERYGFQYGPGFKPIRELAYNAAEALTELELPSEMSTDFGKYLLHPTLMDGALQTVIAFNQETVSENEPILPFGLARLQWYSSLTKRCYVYTKLAADASGSGHLRKYDIRILDLQGQVLAEMQGYSMRAIPSKEKLTSGITAQSKVEKLHYRPVWEAAPLESHRFSDSSLGKVLLFGLSEDLLKAFQDRENQRQKSATSFVLVMPGDAFQDLGNQTFSLDPQKPSDYEQLVLELDNRDLNPDKVLHFWSNDPFHHQTDILDAQLSRGVFSIFHLTQAFMKHRPKNGLIRKMKLNFVFSNNYQQEQPQYAGVAGLARTLSMENPNFQCKTIELRQPIQDWDSTTWTRITEILDQELQVDIGTEFEILYDKDLRKRRSLSEFAPQNQAKQKHGQIREGGTFLITGGGGGLGLIFAAHLLRRYKARVVLTGRSKPGPDLSALTELGGEVSYQVCDVSDREQVHQLLADIRARYGQIHGIIHAAGILRDSFILKKTMAEMKAVLAPKVFGTLHLDEESRADQLDFFVMFSSLTSVHGNLGQADYAFANSFMDSYAERRTSLCQEGTRSGRTLAINWPLWREGGMAVDEAAEKSLTEHLGMKALSTSAGIEAFEDGLAGGENRFLVVEGYRAKIRTALELDATMAKPGPITEEVPTGEVDPSLRGKSEEFLKGILSKETRLPVRKISAEAPLEDYGIDSVMILSLNSELEKVFGDLSKTLLFEYQTISELASYFMENHTAKLLGLFGTPKPPTEAATPVVEKRADAPVFGRQKFASPTPINRPTKDEDIAIISITGRFPMAKNLDVFWQNLTQGKNCIEEIPQDRWNYADYFDENKDQKGTTYSKWGGFIGEVDKFDPLFFNISPREATMMDPQERIFLETSWHTFEDAGYTRTSLKGRDIGVYVGVMWGHYKLFSAEQIQLGNIITPDSNYASVANRVSYFFDLGGPSMTVDTMCSASLTTIHLACESLHRGEIEMALAGGVNLTLHPFKYLLLSRDNFTSSDGLCRSFGEGGDGYVPGEGVGAVLLKPLSQALRDEDRIHGLIKGSAINHGGKTNGYTVPNPKAQSKLVKMALDRSGINPSQLGYMEAHGTGTSLGDPIEIAGLTRALREYKLPAQSLPIGSVKSNIGHLEAAAGIAGLAKVLLQMRHGMLVPSIHSEVLNPNINFKDTPFHVNQKLKPWAQPVLEIDGMQQTFPRMAGISSFGAGGSNAHLIVEQYIPTETMQAHRQESPQVIVLSARNAHVLREHAANMVAFLKTHEQQAIPHHTDNKETIDHVVEELRNIVATILDVELANIEAEVELTELGFDPMLLNTLTEKVQATYGLGESLTFSDNADSLVALAESLVRDYPDAFVSKTPETVAKAPSLSITDLAYTLQTARQAMASRLAIVVVSLSELREKLESFLRKDRDMVSLFAGTVKANEKAEFLSGGRAVEQFILNLVEDREMERLAEMWATVTDIDWQLLYPNQKPKRINLPLYPFERNRYWWTDHEKITVAGTVPTKTVKPTQSQPHGGPTRIDAERERDFILIKSFISLPIQTKTTSSKPRSIQGIPALRTVARAIGPPRTGKVKLKDLHGNRQPTPLNMNVNVAVRVPDPSPSLAVPTQPIPSDPALPKYSANEIKQQIRAVLAQVLLMDEGSVDEQNPMAEMGLDSILLVELAKGINESFGINISTTKLYDYPTVVDLSNYLLDLINDPKHSASERIS